jgi:hypothetical protein
MKEAWKNISPAEDALIRNANVNSKNKRNKMNFMRWS